MVLQDGPPAGGYKALHLERVLPKRGPNGALLFLGTGLVMAAGLYLVGETNALRKEARAEKQRARENIVPFLQAEEDALYVRTKAASSAEEQVLMGDVAPHPYNTRWMPPTSDPWNRF